YLIIVQYRTGYGAQPTIPYGLLAGGATDGHLALMWPGHGQQQTPHNSITDAQQQQQWMQQQFQQLQQPLQPASLHQRQRDARFADWAAPSMTLLPGGTPAMQQQLARATQAPQQQSGGFGMGSRMPMQQHGSLGLQQPQAAQLQPQLPPQLQPQVLSQSMQVQQPQRAVGQLVGWGGQTLPGRTGVAERGRGRTPLRGRGPGPARGTSGPRASRWGGEQHADTIIAQLIAALRALPSNAPAQQVAAPALSQLDSRSVAVLLKSLATHQISGRAWEIFNWLRRIDENSPDAGLRSLADVYSYTAMISSCSSARELDLALELSREMAARGIPRNVHTFSALMNVAIKANQHQLALEVYSEMQQAGCAPNLVTYNTLMDVYGKLGQWTEAMRVLAKMRSE
ncbi:hypothetical protein QJQ45_025022, partial [Haematococcus lacustris]